jgi:rhodanese-related sulfurtransferase
LNIFLFGIVICVGLAFLLIGMHRRRTRKRLELDRHIISPETLHEALTSNKDLLVVDVRQPLDLLAVSETIPGSTRIPPKEVQANPSLIPSNRDVVIYCTCPGDETSRHVLTLALANQLSRIKLLKGGLAAWKAKGYPVDPYRESFHLDVRS